MAEIAITVESPRNDEVVALIRALDSFNENLYPPEANHHLDIEALCAPEITFLTARRGGEIMGIGALWSRADLGFGEVKRMYVRPEARGLGVGHRLLARIELIARGQAIARLMLETGSLNAEAIKLYARAGFSKRGPFGDYPDHPLCVFMEKRLDVGG